MAASVFLLATVRNRNLGRGATLVFDSIRVGFPTSYIKVWVNGPVGGFMNQIIAGCRDNQCDIEKFFQRVTHFAWIEYLVKNCSEPFWIVDGDLIFWSSIEEWGVPQAWLWGRLLPEFFEPYCGAWTQPRLHTSLLYIDPIQVRGRIKEYLSDFPAAWEMLPHPNLFYPQYVPCGPGPDGKVHTKFYDTCSMLYNAIGGQVFTEKELDCYDHLHCGTLSDLVAPRFNSATGRDIIRAHELIYENPILAKGSWRGQDELFKRLATKPAAVA